MQHHIPEEWNSQVHRKRNLTNCAHWTCWRLHFT